MSLPATSTVTVTEISCTNPTTILSSSTNVSQSEPLTLACGVALFSLFALDGVPFVSNAFHRNQTYPDGLATFRVTYELPSSDFSGLTMRVYLPYPLFYTNNSDVQLVYVDDNFPSLPAAYTVYPGYSDSLFEDVFPTVALLQNQSSLTISYGTYIGHDTGSNIDLLITLPLSGIPVPNFWTPFVTAQVRFCVSFFPFLSFSFTDWPSIFSLLSWLYLTEMN